LKDTFSARELQTFVPRLKELNNLRNAFNIKNVVLLNGMAGVGKTWLARHFSAESKYDETIFLYRSKFFNTNSILYELVKKN